MKTDAIAALYRRYTDEPDATALLAADVALDLLQAYAEFRNTVNQVLPWYYSTTREIDVSALVGDYQVYDLTQAGVSPAGAGTPSIMGEQPNDAGTPVPRMAALLNIETVTARVDLEPVSSFEALRNGGYAYFLRGDELWFPKSVDGTMRLHYTEQQSVGIGGAVFDPTWVSVLTPATGVFLDDMGQWHDIIALLAYSNYAITDVAENPALISRLQMRMAGFREFLQQTDFSGPRYVARVPSSASGGRGN